MSTLAEQLNILNQRNYVNDLISSINNAISFFSTASDTLKNNTIFAETFPTVTQEYIDYLDEVVLKLAEINTDFPIDPTANL